MSTTRIAKGFSLCTAIVGAICFLTGVGIAVCAWVLNGQLPADFYYELKTRDEYEPEQRGRIHIGNYWWGGLIYVIPGFLGVVAGCTRSVAAMIFYLIFNLLCCICSLVVVVVCAIVLLVWVPIDQMLQGVTGQCTGQEFAPTKYCRCEGDVESITLYGDTCDVFFGIQAIIGAMISLAAISSILSFIASYISCCSLCNKERTNNGHIIIAGGPGVYQPPPVVVNNTAPSYPAQNPQTVGGYGYHATAPMNTSYPPPPYQQHDTQPHYGGGQGGNVGGAPPTDDRAGLISNQYN